MFPYHARSQLHSHSPLSLCLAQCLWQSTGRNHFALLDLGWLQRVSQGVIASWGWDGTSDSVHLSCLPPRCRVHHQTSVPHTHLDPARAQQWTWADSCSLAPQQWETAQSHGAAAGVCSNSLENTHHNVYLWAGFGVFSMSQKIPFRKGCFISLFKNALRPLVIFIRF